MISGVFQDEHQLPGWDQEPAFIIQGVRERQAKHNLSKHFSFLLRGHALRGSPPVYADFPLTFFIPGLTRTLSTSMEEALFVKRRTAASAIEANAFRNRKVRVRAFASFPRGLELNFLYIVTQLISRVVVWRLVSFRER